MGRPYRSGWSGGKPDSARRTIRPTGRLPAGRIDLCFGLGRDGRPRVHSVAVTIPDRGDAVRRTQAIGDGAAVLEFDGDDRSPGPELRAEQSRRAPDARERSIRGKPDADLRVAALHTARHVRHDLSFSLKVLLAAKVAPSRAVETSTATACPRTRTWDARRGLVAC